MADVRVRGTALAVTFYEASPAASYAIGWRRSAELYLFGSISTVRWSTYASRHEGLRIAAL